MFEHVAKQFVKQDDATAKPPKKDDGDGRRKPTKQDEASEGITANSK